MQKQDISGKIIATILIAAGIILLLKRTTNLLFPPDPHLFHLFYPFKNLGTGIFHVVLSWQMALLITGGVLIAGRRSSGIVLVVIGGIFLLHRILNISSLSFPLFIPVLLIFAGAIVTGKTSFNVNN